MTTSDPEFAARWDHLGRFFMGSSDVHAAVARVATMLDDLRIPYVIVGALAVNVHGHVRVTNDVDLLLTPEGLAQFKQRVLGRGWVERFPGSRGLRDADNQVKIDVLLTGGIPGDGTPHGVVFPDPALVAIERDGKKYVALTTLVEMKLASGLTSPDRPRDFDDVIQLIRANTLGEHFGDQLHPYVHAKYRELWGYAQRPTGEY